MLYLPLAANFGFILFYLVTSISLYNCKMENNSPLTQLSLGLCPGSLFAKKGHDSLHHCLHQCWGTSIRLDLRHVPLIQRLQSLGRK